MTSTGHKDRVRAVHDYMQRKASHTSTTNLHLPAELVTLLEIQAASLNDLARRVGILESCIKSAGETLDEIDRRRRAAG